MTYIPRFLIFLFAAVLAWSLFSPAQAQDTTPPTVVSVMLSEESGNIDFSFDTDERLGSDPSGITVSVDGPNTPNVYSFDRSDFVKMDNGDGTFTYALSAAQAYDDGDGTYEVTLTVGSSPSAWNQSVTLTVKGGVENNVSGITRTPTVEEASDPQVQNAKLTDQTDGNGTVSPGDDVKISVDVNEPPVAKNDTDDTKQGEPTTTDVLANDEDPDGDELDPTTVTIQEDPSDGEITSIDAQTGAVTYEPNDGFTAADTYTYTVEDQRGAESGEATVTIEVVNNPSPEAAFEVDPANPQPGETVTFDASGSSDDGQIVSYEWDFGDGTTGSGEVAQHAYDTEGDYEVTLTVTDDGGKTGEASQTVQVSTDAPPTAAFEVDPTNPQPGEPVTFDADSSSDDGQIESYEWEFGDGTSGSGEMTDHTYDEAGSYAVLLTVTDDAGQSATETEVVEVGDDSPPQIQSATLTDQENNDGTVSSGDQVQVSAEVSDQGGSGIASVEADVSAFDAGGSDDTATLTDGNGDGTYEATFTVGTSPSGGDQSADVTATDGAGNSATETTSTLTVQTGDQTSPQVQNATLTDQENNDGTVSSGDQVQVSAEVSDQGGSGIASVGAEVSAFDAGGSDNTVELTDGNGDGTYEATFTVGTSPSGGDQSADVTATDGAGNSAMETTGTLTVQVDTTPPAIENATLTDLTDGDGTVSVGDEVEVSAGVSEGGSGVESVTADVSAFDAGGSDDTATLTDGNGDGTYEATFTVGTSPSGGDQSADVTATDGAGNSAMETTGALTVNEPPTIDTNAGVAVTEGQSAAITTSELSASDPDDSASDLTFEVTTAPTQGDLLVNGSSASSFTQQDIEQGNVEYDHTAGNADDDSFVFDLTDPSGEGPSGTFNITVNEANQAPTARADEDTTTAGQPVTTDVLANDSDPDGNLEPSTVTVQSDPSSGTATVNTDGTITYDPNDGFTGEDSYTYTVKDDDGATSNEATVTITVNAGNQPPTARDTTLMTDEDTETSGNAPGVLGNDTDPDGDDLSVSQVNGSTGDVGLEITLDSEALLTLNADGSYTYDPNGQFETLGDGEEGSDSFTYTASDGNGGTDQATVTVTITGVNDAPEASDDSDETTEGQPVTTGVLANDSDPDGTLDASTVTVQSAPSSGVATVNTDGTITYEPNDGFTGTDSYTYTVKDNDGATSNEATVEATVTVNPQ